MKFTKALGMLLALALVLTLGFTIVACGGGEDPCTEHVDADANGKCDKCDADVKPEGGDEVGGGATADDITLISGGAATFTVVATNDVQTALGKTLTNFVKTINQCIEESNVELKLDTVPSLMRGEYQCRTRKGQSRNRRNGSILS